MRVLSLRLGSYSCTGGIERICRDSDRILTDAGITLTVVSLWDHAQDMPASNGEQRYYGCGRNKLLFLWRFLVCLLVCRWDIVWVQHRLLSPLAMAVRLLTRARIIVWVFGLEVWDRPSPWARICLRRADLVLAISSFTARKCESLYRVPHDRMRVCPLGVSRSMETHSKKPAAHIPPSPYVLIVSRLVLPAAEQKGVLRVCEALSKVLAQVPEANCAIVGGGPAQPAIRARIEQLGLAGRIVLTGHLDDAELRWMYEHAAVLALPSTVEGFGLVYVEAMIRRVPVVAGRLDAAVDVVVDGVTGLLVNPLDVDAIAAALVTLLKDETLRAKMGAAGYDRVQEEFTYEAMARRLRKAFEELAP